MNSTTAISADSRVCIATFTSTTGASAFRQLCDMYWIPARLTPVPQSLNSDCPACVQFELNGALPFSLSKLPESAEELAERMPDGTWREGWHAKH